MTAHVSKPQKSRGTRLACRRLFTEEILYVSSAEIQASSHRLWKLILLRTFKISRMPCSHLGMHNQSEWKSAFSEISVCQNYIRAKISKVIRIIKRTHTFSRKKMKLPCRLVVVVVRVNVQVWRDSCEIKLAKLVYIYNYTYT